MARKENETAGEYDTGRGNDRMECQNWNNHDGERGNGYGYGPGTGYENPYGGEYGYRYGTPAGGRPPFVDEKQALREIRRCFSRVGLVYVAYLGLSYLSQWIMALLFAWTDASQRLGRNLTLFLAILSMYPLAVPLTALFMKWVPARGQVGRERWGIGKLAGFFVFCMGILYAGNMIGTILMAIAGVIKGEPIANDMQELIMSMEPWTVLISAVIIAPIMEELVFRKFLLDRIAGFGHWTAILVSGMIFGIAHGNFYQFFYAFGLGVVFAYVYLHTGRIIYTMVFHILINFCGSILPLGLLALMEKNVLLAGLLAMGNVMSMFGFVICAVVLLAVCHKELVFLPAGDGLPRGKRTAAIWINGGMILFLVCGAILFGLAL